MSEDELKSSDHVGFIFDEEEKIKANIIDSDEYEEKKVDDTLRAFLRSIDERQLTRMEFITVALNIAELTLQQSTFENATGAMLKRFCDRHFNVVLITEEELKSREYLLTLRSIVMEIVNDLMFDMAIDIAKELDSDSEEDEPEGENENE